MGRPVLSVHRTFWCVLAVKGVAVGLARAPRQSRLVKEKHVATRPRVVRRVWVGSGKAAMESPVRAWRSIEWPHMAGETRSSKSKPQMKRVKTNG